MELPSLLQKTSKVPFHLAGPLNLSALNPFPKRFRTSPRRTRPGRKESRAGRTPTSAAMSPAGNEQLTRLSFSLDPAVTLRALREHSWRASDLQYVLLAATALFCLVITPPAPLIKIAAVALGALLLLVPLTSQFFFPALPMWAYLLFFFCSRFIDAAYRPHIWVRVLPALENVLYGANLSNILSAHTHPLLDILAWVPYGIIHFAGPLTCAVVIFAFAAPGTTAVYGATIGWMNLLGVFIQIIFPCTPPWYENEHGLSPAHYGMPGSPAGLARVDAIFGLDMYTTSFSTAPVPFGAFPSLHSGNAVMEALFLSYCFPALRPLFVAYCVWIWWATMYLSHHYAIDLVGGALIAALFFYSAKSRWLPRRQPDKRWRWDHEYVELGDYNAILDPESAPRSAATAV